jgi:hypothetical protein
MPANLTLYPYCGMRMPLVEDGDLDECRRYAAKHIRTHRNNLEYPVTIIDRGLKWELESDPEGRYMIGDHEGILAIKVNEAGEDEDCNNEKL